ncbi:MAG: hypothetical protein KDD47_26905, partial [Acidobacteria bacterium]|nr:hypothetical protein [Acidobacteriota bacterium]
YTNDGTYLRGKDAPSSCPAPPPGVSGTCRTVEFPDGTEHVFFDVGTVAEPNWRLTEMRDRFGNDVEISYGDFDWTLTDSVGRTQVISFDPAGVARTWKKVVSVDLSAFDAAGSPNGARAVFTFSYETPSIERHRYHPLLAGIPCNTPPDVISNPLVAVDLLVQVRQPDGSFYAMTNDHSETENVAYVLGSKSGALRELKIPTGALVQWDYDNLSYLFFYTIPAGFEPEQFGANSNYGVVRKEVFDADGLTSLAVWTYEPDQGPEGPTASDLPCYSENKVTDPEGGWVIHYFHTLDFPFGYLSGAPFTICNPGSQAPVSPLQGPYLSREIFEHDGVGGWKRRTLLLDFEDDGPLANGGTGAEVRYRLQRTIFHDDNGYVVDRTRSDHDGLGHYRQEVTTSTFPEGRNTKTVLTRYNPTSGTLGGSPRFQLPPVGDPWT